MIFRRISIFLVGSGVLLLVFGNHKHGDILKWVYEKPWISPEVVDTGGEYLCTCSRKVVLESEMLRGPHAGPLDPSGKPVPRTCKIDHSLERHRFICAYFSQFEIPKYLTRVSQSSARALRVLHNAPEYSIAHGLHIFNNSHVDYVGFDYAVGPLPYNDGFNEFKLDLCALPFPENYFDMAITSHVLEHVPSLKGCVKELHRVLRPGGVAFIAIPYYEEPKTVEKKRGKKYSQNDLVKMFGQKDHVRRIGQDFVHLLNQTGFVIDPITPKQFYGEYFPDAKAKFKNAEFRDSYDEKGIFFVVKESAAKSRPNHMVHL